MRECARRFLAGESIRAICADLNERGERAATGGEWSPQTLRRMLGSARIAGQREHKGEIVAKAEWPAIITQADSARSAHARRPGAADEQGARRYLLVRLLRCSCVGSRWSPGPARAASAATPARRGRASAAAGRCTSRRTRSRRSSSRRSFIGSTRPSWQLRSLVVVPRSLMRSGGAGGRRRPGAARGARRGRVRAAADRDGRVARSPRADRAALERGPQGARQGQPLDRPRRLRRPQPRRLRGSLGRALDLDPPARDRRAVLDHVDVVPAAAASTASTSHG